jgi:two-component system NtrC family sensor kinase
MPGKCLTLPDHLAGIDEKILLQAVEQNPASIIITTPSSEIIYVNQHFCKLTGYSFEEVIGQNPRILKGDDGYTDYRLLWKTLLAGEPWQGEFHNRRKDGSYFWDLATISPIRGEEGEILYYLAIQEDYTERKKVDEQLQITVSQATQLTSNLEVKNFQLETAQRKLDEAYSQLKVTQSQMLQREKMASIGQLAAGVAHEINNPMGFISSNLSSLGKYVKKMSTYIDSSEALVKTEAPQLFGLLESDRKKGKIDYLIEDAEDLIDESLEGAERVRKIVLNLKRFSHVDTADVQLADINKCLEETINIAWNEIKYKAKLEKHFGELPQIPCRPQELNQVFMNILVNAVQAIGQEGLIGVATRVVDGMLRVDIRDNGCGIPENFRNRIFEPFFTTKEVGKGTGLGMSISFDIIKKHGGEILIESEPGVGTCFTILLPLVNHFEADGQEEKP